MAGRHQHTIFAIPIGTATPNDVYTQQATKAALQDDINTQFWHLLLAQLPRTTFTHSKLPKPHGRRHQHNIITHLLSAQLPRTTFTHSKLPKPHGRATSTQNFRNSYWHSYPERRLHSASCQSRMAGRHQHTIFASPIGGTAAPNDVYTQQAGRATSTQHENASPIVTPNKVYTQQAAKAAWQDDINTKFSQLPSQRPRTTRGTSTQHDDLLLRPSTIPPRSSGFWVCDTHNRGPPTFFFIAESLWSVFCSQAVGS